MAGKTRGIVIGIALVMVLKALFYIFRVTIKTLANAIVFLGLYIPLFYFVFALVLVNVSGIDLSVMDINVILLLVGGGLSVICGLIITIRNLIIRPFSSIFDSFRRERFPTYRQVEADYYNRHNARRGTLYYEDKREEYETFNKRPTIYYSEREPNLLIHEYSDRFEVFRDDGVQPKVYLRTEYK